MNMNERLNEIMARAKADSQFKRELLASPREVMARELGVPVDDTEQEMDEKALGVVAGGSSGYRCPQCKAPFQDFGDLAHHLVAQHGIP